MDLSIQNAAYMATSAVRTRARDLYDGADVVKGKGAQYLFPESSEIISDGQVQVLSDSYSRRLARAAYENVCKRIIDWRMAVLFRREATRELGLKASLIAENVDRNGTHANVFFNRVARDAQIDGVCFVGVDMPYIGEDVKQTIVTAADEDRLGIRPFLEHIPATAVIDWAFDDSNELVFVVIAQATEDRRTVPGESFTPSTQYKVWTREQWLIYESANGGLISSGKNPFGAVPVVPFYGDKLCDMAGWPVTRAILDHAVLLYNQQSDLDWFLRLAAHPVPVVIAPKAPEVVNSYGGLHVETSGLSGPDPQVFYLETSGNSFEAARKSISDIRFQIYSTALAQAKHDGAQVEAADTQREYRRMFTGGLKMLARDFERAEEEVWRIVSESVGERPESVSVSYSQDYDDTLIDSSMVSMLTEMNDRGLISRDALLGVLMDGELLPPGFDPEEDKALIAQEAVERASYALADLRKGISEPEIAEDGSPAGTE